MWREGKEILLDPNGRTGEAFAVNHDGSVIVGTGYRGGFHAYLWTASAATDLGILPRSGPNSNPQQRAYATAVSDDGKVVVGFSGFGGDRDAFIWTPETGMVKLDDYARQKGATGLEGWDLGYADSISANGKVIAGNGAGPRGPEGWVLNLP